MSDPPPFDARLARRLTGARILVGVTFRRSDGTVRLQHQYHGVVVSADDRGVAVVLDGVSVGQTLDLPPDLRSFAAATPGTYRLRSTGEIVDTPDFICDWIVELAEPDGAASDAALVDRLCRNS